MLTSNQLNTRLKEIQIKIDAFEELLQETTPEQMEKYKQITKNLLAKEIDIYLKEIKKPEIQHAFDMLNGINEVKMLKQTIALSRYMVRVPANHVFTTEMVSPSGFSAEDGIYIPARHFPS